MKGYTVESNPNKVKITRTNILVEGLVDMQELEDWEFRLAHLKQHYAIAFKKTRKKVSYTIFSPLYKKGSVFK